MSRSSSQRRARSILPQWWRRQAWLTVLTVAVACILSFVVVFACTPPGQQALCTLRFVLGWYNLAWQQQQLNDTLRAWLQKMGVSARVYRQEGGIAQRRGREHWQQRTHIVDIPSELSLTVCEATLHTTISRLPYVILERRERTSPASTVVEITLGIAGVQTDMLILTQRRVGFAASPSAGVQSATLQPQVAIIIDDLGWDLGVARTLLALEAPLSLAILPHTPYQMLIAHEAEHRGRDILLHLPMEPYRYPQVDPGKSALLSTMNSQEIALHIEGALAAMPAVIGVNNHMGSRLTEDREAMRVVMQLLKQRNLFFLDSRTSQKSLAYQVARELGVRAAQRQVFLDNTLDVTKIQQQLYYLATLAHTHGSAIGIGHPYPETVRTLRYTLPALRQTGIDIVPISRLVK